jgi:hypothetical protein
MKKLTTILLTIFALTAASAANAQFKVKIPKLPKVKEQPSAEQPATPPNRGDNAASADDGQSRANAPSKSKSKLPTEASVKIEDTTLYALTSSFEIAPNKWTTGWLPKIDFYVNGPVESGARLRVEFAYPGKANWLACEPTTNPVAAGDYIHVWCNGPFQEKDRSTYTGNVDFTIKMFNELAGTNKTLFTGKFNVKKAPPNTTKKTDFVYFVDYDWTLPIGYLWASTNDYGAGLPMFRVTFWLRGNPNAADPDPHIFYQGKEIAGDYPDCTRGLVIEPTQYVDENTLPKPIWVNYTCYFGKLAVTNQTREHQDFFRLDKNPGEYEFKLLRNGRLSRSIKFTVHPDGSFDNGIASANKLHPSTIIVPATVLGDQDGAYDKNAYKAGAFWGHPLTGFIPN